MKCRLWISFFGEMGKWEVGKWGSGEVEKWRNGEMGKWGSGEVEKWRNAVVEVNKASLIDLKVSTARTDGGWQGIK